MTSEAGCEISKQNARDFVKKTAIEALKAWKHCGCTGCVFCDEVVRARDERIAALPPPPLPPPPVDRTAQTTTDGRPVDEVRAEQEANGNKMHASYIVLSAEERARGFVRPVRRSYRHVGIPGPRGGLRDLTAEEAERYKDFGYAKFEPYPESESPKVGRYWTHAELAKIGKGCGTVTTMGVAIAETYARDPKFYGSTMCVGCGTHLRVGAAGEFVWEGTNERVGT